MFGMVRRIGYGHVDATDPRFARVLARAVAARAEGYSIPECIGLTRLYARNGGYNDIASVLVALVIAVYLVVIFVPIILTEITTMTYTGFPTGTSTLFSTLLPVLIIVGAVYLVWKLIKGDGGL